MSAFSLRPNVGEMPYVKISYNVGALLDIPTGRYETGAYGEEVLNGGVGSVTGIVSYGNNYKTTEFFFMLLTPMARMHADAPGSVYETEYNLLPGRVRDLSKHIRDFNGEDVMGTGRLKLSDKSNYMANDWYEMFKTYAIDKSKSGKAFYLPTPFLDRDGKSFFNSFIPSMWGVDSFSEFETDDVAAMQDIELGDSKANTVYMRAGLTKTRFLQDVPKYINMSNNYCLFTVQMGKEGMSDGKTPPPKRLQYLKNGDKMTGASPKFAYLTTNCWHLSNSATLYNDLTKGPEYPRTSEDILKGDTDLQTVSLTSLRNKYGGSGQTLLHVVSQSEGVMPSLTEFHYIKTNERYGLAGNNINYELDLLPGVALSRTSIRRKLDSNAMLRRAVLITSEMCQMKWLWHKLPEGLLCSPKELYEDLIKKGYDWNILLNTRSWWAFNNDTHEVPFLSTMDLLNMRQGTYHPFWYPLLPGMKERPMNKGAILREPIKPRDYSAFFETHKTKVKAK